uniref:Uncharacterized protein n=1 Tax=Rangifer tarandus platyrhynchus TaxID=3082113 RepID=A0ACB0F5B7_RANTA|nr:unnamed protein product [Rangifer tarandus platyrhynchus]
MLSVDLLRQMRQGKDPPESKMHQHPREGQLWALGTQGVAVPLGAAAREEELHIPLGRERKVGARKTECPRPAGFAPAAHRLFLRPEGLDPSANPGPRDGADPRGPPGRGGRPEVVLSPWERAGVEGREIKRANCGRPRGRRSEKGQGRQQPTQNRLPPGACPSEGSQGPEGARDRFRCPFLPAETWKPGLETGRAAETPRP